MHDHFLYQVVKAMDKADAEAMHMQLKQAGKERSKALFKLLRQCDKDITKADIHTKLFRNKYTADKDYLLRNEFRILKKALEKFLLAKECEAELNDNAEWRNRMLANAMIKYQLAQRAMGYFEEAREAALFNFHFDTAIEMNMSLVSLQYRNPAAANDIVQLILDNADSNKQLLQEAAIYRAAQIQFQEALAHRLAKAKTNSPHDSDTTPAELIKQLPWANTRASEFYIQKAKAYNTYSIDDMTRLVHLAEALPQNPLIRNERLTAIVQLASITSMQGNFEQADELFRSIYLTDDFAFLKEKPSFYINYTRNLTKLKKYEEALKVIDKAEAVVIESHLLTFLETARLTCYIYLKDREKLKQWLPTDFTEIADLHRSYYKLLYAIYFYLDGQIGMAIRELENLLNTRHISELIGPQDLAHIMLAVFRIVEKDGMGNLSKAAGKKAADIINKQKQLLPLEVQNMLPLMWMEETFCI